MHKKDTIPHQSNLPLDFHGYTLDMDQYIPSHDDRDIVQKGQEQMLYAENMLEEISLTPRRNIMRDVV